MEELGQINQLASSRVAKNIKAAGFKGGGLNLLYSLRGDPGIKIPLFGQICQQQNFTQKCVGNIVLICKIIIVLIK